MKVFRRIGLSIALSLLAFAPRSFAQTGGIIGGTHDHDSTYVNEGQPGSITSGMMVDGVCRTEILDDDGAGSGLDADLLDGLDSTSFWKLGGNGGTTAGTNFLGTTDLAPLELKVNGARALRLEPGSSLLLSPNVIGGSATNVVSSGVFGATIGGGGRTSFSNIVSDHFGTVGGGLANQVGDFDPSTAVGQAATVAGGKGNMAIGFGDAVGGGDGNTASGGDSFVGGGSQNSATDNQATVCGGDSNTASSVEATVGGGNQNTASGPWSTVPGGDSNTAAGSYSFAAGQRATIGSAHHGTFLFADSTNADFNSVAANEFAVRASGGFRFRTSSALSTGCNLPAGSGTFSCTSVRSTKTSFRAVDPVAIAKAVAALPIQTWSYKEEPGSVRHIGPVAQDFHAAFSVGADDKHIATVDADGVALAAIQGLYGMLEKKEAEMAELEASYRKQISALEERLEALEKTVARGGRPGTRLASK